MRTRLRSFLVKLPLGIVTALAAVAFLRMPWDATGQTGLELLRSQLDGEMDSYHLLAIPAALGLGGAGAILALINRRPVVSQGCGVLAGMLLIGAAITTLLDDPAGDLDQGFWLTLASGLLLGVLVITVRIHPRSSVKKNRTEEFAYTMLVAQKSDRPAPPEDLEREKSPLSFAYLIRVKTGESHILYHGETLIGRNEFINDVVVKQQDVSREHALIYEQDGELTLYDRASASGTWLNGQRIEMPHKLRHGDRITIGKLTFEVVILANL